MSTGYPSFKRAARRSNASFAWRSKMSKWLIRSLLKNGRVIARWNFHISPELRSSQHRSLLLCIIKFRLHTIGVEDPDA
jgi:hypothetical protein